MVNASDSNEEGSYLLVSLQPLRFWVNESQKLVSNVCRAVVYFEQEIARVSRLPLATAVRSETTGLRYVPSSG